MPAEWQAVYCLECRTAIAFSPEPVHVTQPMLCYLCAHAHARVASTMIGGSAGLSTQGLYAVDNSGGAMRKGEEFNRVFNGLYAKLEKHRVAKAYIKSTAKSDNA
jgi:hypothetical protein